MRNSESKDSAFASNHQGPCERCLGIGRLRIPWNRVSLTVNYPKTGALANWAVEQEHHTPKIWAGPIFLTGPAQIGSPPNLALALLDLSLRGWF